MFISPKQVYKLMYKTWQNWKPRYREQTSKNKLTGPPFLDQNDPPQKGVTLIYLTTNESHTTPSSTQTENDPKTKFVKWFVL